MASRVLGRRTGGTALLSAALLLAALAPAPVAAAGPAIAQQAYAKASNPGLYGYFGGAVAVSGNTMVVGARGESSASPGVNGDQTDTSLAGAGAAYVFVRSGGVWTQQAYLKASNPEANAEFGYAVAISGDTIAVAAPWEKSAATGINGNEADTSASEAGAVYVFTRTNGTWSQQAYLKASNTDAGDGFGYSVAIDGNLMVVGAAYESSASTGVNGDERSNDAQFAGAAYVFGRLGSTWTQAAYLKASNARANAFFGTSVAISGSSIVVGAPSDSSAATGVNGNQADTTAPNAGAAYVFALSGPVWYQQAYLKASEVESGDQFGTAVGISGNTVAVGAPYAVTGTGAASVFARSGTTWTPQADLVPTVAPDAGDWFGMSVAVSGDTILVGASAEDGGATGVNGDATLNTVTGSGAAYSFVRTGAAWAQQAYLKASNTGLGDSLGSSVAVSGDVLVVGASNEASSSPGVNGDGTDNSVDGAGAAYAFFRSPIATKTTIASASSVTLGATLKVAGTVSPSAAPGTVTVSRYRLESGKWKLIGAAKVAVKAGKYAYAFKPNARGSWRLAAAYSGGAGDGATYSASKSANKAVTVK